MRIDVITLFPEMVEAALAVGMPGRALRQGKVELVCWNPRAHATDPYRSVDERPFGGGPGMVMTIDPLRPCIAAARSADARPVRITYLSPQGVTLSQRLVETLAGRERLLLLCGRYEAVDQRLIDHWVDEEISIGDYVLSGGEPAAIALIDAVARLLPGVLHTAASAVEDSFSTGLLDCPHYTRPEHSDLGPVPSVLLSGDHAAIARWRRKQALRRTWLRRPDLLAAQQMNRADRNLLDEVIAEFQCERKLL